MDANITLLIVEDEALIAENLRLSLEDLGYAVAATCYTYAEAQRAFQEHSPDLVLLDINLSSPNPDHNGLALAQQLGTTPFIFLTAYSDLDTIRQATRLQPSGYLIKPVNAATLFAAIQTAIERTTTRQVAPWPVPSATPAAAPDFFFVKNGLHTVKLYWREVASLEAGKNYVTLRAPALRLSHAVRGSLSYVLDQLLPAALREQFIRVNRAAALNASFISSYDQDFVYCGEERYENGRTALKQLQELELK
jgi:DNA-binding response OmpR family regulator